MGGGIRHVIGAAQARQGNRRVVEAGTTTIDQLIQCARDPARIGQVAGGDGVGERKLSQLF